MMEVILHRDKRGRMAVSFSIIYHVDAGKETLLSAVMSNNFEQFLLVTFCQIV
jgi:hypothetical protein